MASSKGLKVDRKEIQAAERNSSRQGQAGTRPVLGRAARIPTAGLARGGKEGPVCRHLKGGCGEGDAPGGRKRVGP